MLRTINQYCRCVECAEWECKILPQPSFLIKRPLLRWHEWSHVTIQYRSEIQWFRIICEDRDKDSSCDADYLEITTGVVPLWVLCGVLAHRFPLSTLMHFDWFGLAGSINEPNLHGMVLQYDSWPTADSRDDYLVSTREKFQENAVLWIAEGIHDLSPPNKDE